MTAQQSHANPRRIIVAMNSGEDAIEQVNAALKEADMAADWIDDASLEELGVLFLGAADEDAALHALMDAGLKAITSDSIVFRMSDKPGALAEILRTLGEKQLNVRTLHIVHQHGGYAIAAVTTDDDVTARSLLDKDALL